jgi:hypothetical protein
VVWYTGGVNREEGEAPHGYHPLLHLDLRLAGLSTHPLRLLFSPVGFPEKFILSIGAPWGHAGAELGRRLGEEQEEI